MAFVVIQMSSIFIQTIRFFKIMPFFVFRLPETLNISMPNKVQLLGSQNNATAQTHFTIV